MPGHGDDIVVLAMREAHGLAKTRQMPDESAFLDHGLAPDFEQELVLGDDTIPVLDEQLEDVE